MTKAGFAVSVYFHVKPGQMDKFRSRMIVQAKESLALEDKCRHFDIGFNASKPDTIFLYELYDDAAAFDAHLGSAHFQQFEQVVAEIVIAREIETWDLVTA